MNSRNHRREFIVLLISASALLFFITDWILCQTSGASQFVNLDNTKIVDEPIFDDKHIEQPAVNMLFNGSTQIGLNQSLDSVILNVRKNSIQVLLKTTRLKCQTGQCVFRVYLLGPSVLGGYLTSTTECNGCYSIAYNVHETGAYQTLVSLEAWQDGLSAMKNTFPDDVAIGSIMETTYIVSEKLSNFSARIHINTSVQHASDIPNINCTYSAYNYSRNQFEWVDRSRLVKRGYSPLNSLMIPSEQLGTNISHSAILKSADKLIPEQLYVWFPRNCRQQMITAHMFNDAVRKRDIAELVFVGTSRVGDFVNTLLAMYHVEGIVPNATIKFISTVHWHGRTNDLLGKLTRHFDKADVCMPAGAHEAKKVAIVVSLGIWEATHGGELGHPFEPRIFSNATLTWIGQRCSSHTYSIVVCTQPQVHAWKAHEDPRRSNRTVSLEAHKQSLIGRRIEEINKGWVENAQSRNLLVVDGESPSISRFDMCPDNVHYMFFNRITGKKPRKRRGNEVAHVTTTMILAAVINSTFILPK